MPLAAGGSLNAAVHTRPLQLDWNLEFTQTPTILARDYWRSRRRAYGMPARADIAPAAMRKFVAHAGLSEIRPGTRQVDYFIRLAGTRWEDVFGPMTGRFLEDFLPPEIEMRWRTVFDAVRKAATPVGIATGIEFQGKSWLTCEMFVAPLGDAAHNVTMLFLCFASGSSVRR